MTNKSNRAIQNSKDKEMSRNKKFLDILNDVIEQDKDEIDIKYEPALNDKIMQFVSKNKRNPRCFVCSN